MREQVERILKDAGVKAGYILEDTYDGVTVHYPNDTVTTTRWRTAFGMSVDVSPRLRQCGLALEAAGYRLTQQQRGRDAALHASRG